MSTVAIDWHRIAWQMARHLCGPIRASEHELARRYRRARGHHLPLEVRAARLRAMVDRDEEQR